VPPPGDLTIHLVGPCTFYADIDGYLWINPTLQAQWAGTWAPFPATDFNMKTNYGKATAGGPINNTTPFTWAIGGETPAADSWLGRTILLTVTINPAHDVSETNYTNNVTLISVHVPASYSTTETTIPCNLA
jgi:hypothetical protein